MVVGPAICGPASPAGVVAASAVVRRREARRRVAGPLTGAGVLRRPTNARILRIDAAALVLSRLGLAIVRRRFARTNMRGVRRAAIRRALGTFARALVRRRATRAGTRKSRAHAFRVGVAHAYVVVAAACDGTVPSLSRLEAGAGMRPDVAGLHVISEQIVPLTL